FCFFFQAEDGIRDYKVTGVQTCALPICWWRVPQAAALRRRKFSPRPGHRRRSPLFSTIWSSAIRRSKIIGAGGSYHVKVNYEPRSEERRVGRESRDRRARRH